MKKFWLALFVLLVAVVIAAVFTRNGLVGKFVEWQVYKTTGFPLRIDSFYWDLRGGWISARGITLDNPPEFKERTFAHIQEMYVELDWSTLLHRQTHIKTLMLNIDDIHFIKKADGTSNAIHLRGVNSSEDRTPRTLQIDTLRLLIDTVHVTDDSHLINHNPTYRLKLDRRFENVKELTAINRLILWTILKRVPLDLGLTLDKLSEGLEAIIGFPFDLLKGAAGVVEKAGKAVIDSISQ